MSLSTDVADAIALHLKAGEFSQAVDPKRVWFVNHTPGQLQKLQVAVTPGPFAVEQAARGVNVNRRWVDVAIQKKVAPEKNEQVDPLMQLVEEIAEHLLGGSLATANGRSFRIVRVESIPSEAAAIARDHLEDWRIFTAVLRVECLMRS